MRDDRHRDLTNLIERAASVEALAEIERAVVTLGEVKIKGEKGIEAKIGCSNIEHNRTVLGEHVGDHVLMLMVDSETFMGEREPAQVDPDQPELPGGHQAGEAA